MGACFKLQSLTVGATGSHLQADVKPESRKDSCCREIPLEVEGQPARIFLGQQPVCSKGYVVLRCTDACQIHASM